MVQCDRCGNILASIKTLIKHINRVNRCEPIIEDLTVNELIVRSKLPPKNPIDNAEENQRNDILSQNSIGFVKYPICNYINVID